MRNNPRDQIPALKNKYYFNYGGQGPLPKSSLEAIVKTWEIIQDLGPHIFCENSSLPYLHLIKDCLSRYNLNIVQNQSERLFLSIYISLKYSLQAE